MCEKNSFRHICLKQLQYIHEWCLNLNDMMKHVLNLNVCQIPIHYTYTTLVLGKKHVKTCNSHVLTTWLIYAVFTHLNLNLKVSWDHHSILDGKSALFKSTKQCKHVTCGVLHSICVDIWPRRLYPNLWEPPALPFFDGLVPTFAGYWVQFHQWVQ